MMALPIFWGFEASTSHLASTAIHSPEVCIRMVSSPFSEGNWDTVSPQAVMGPRTDSHTVSNGAYLLLKYGLSASLRIGSMLAWSLFSATAMLLIDSL